MSAAGGGCPWIPLGVEIDPAVDAVHGIATHNCGCLLFLAFLAGGGWWLMGWLMMVVVMVYGGG